MCKAVNQINAEGKRGKVEHQLLALFRLKVFEALVKENKGADTVSGNVDHSVIVKYTLSVIFRKGELNSDEGDEKADNTGTVKHLFLMSGKSEVGHNPAGKIIEKVFVAVFKFKLFEKVVYNILLFCKKIYNFIDEIGEEMHKEKN